MPIRVDTAFRNASKFLSAWQIVLLALDNKSMEGRTHKQLQELTGLTPAAITMAKNKLVSLNLAVEHYPHRDLRSVRVYLSSGGTKEVKALWKAMSDLGAVKAKHRNSRMDY